MWGIPAPVFGDLFKVNCDFGTIRIVLSSPWFLVVQKKVSKTCLDNMVTVIENCNPPLYELQQICLAGYSDGLSSGETQMQVVNQLSMWSQLCLQGTYNHWHRSVLIKSFTFMNFLTFLKNKIAVFLCSYVVWSSKISLESVKFSFHFSC